MTDAPFESTSSENAIVAEIQRLMTARRTPIFVAIDGRSGTGKSTLAVRVAARVGATVVEGDDFYAGGDDSEWKQRSVREKVRDCIDWRRLKSEALDHLLAGHTATWHPFNFETGTGLAAHSVSREPADVIILDGVYSARPELREIIDLSVLVEVPDDLARRHRLVAREGQTFMDSWHALWDGAEDYYFTQIRPPSSFDLVVTSG
jgi:uridine kinase